MKSGTRSNLKRKKILAQEFKKEDNMKISKTDSEQEKSKQH